MSHGASSCRSNPAGDRDWGGVHGPTRSWQRSEVAGINASPLLGVIDDSRPFRCKKA